MRSIGVDAKSKNEVEVNTWIPSFNTETPKPVRFYIHKLYTGVVWWGVGGLLCFIY